MAVTAAVPDILSQGGGRETGPWPRRVAAAVVLVLVAVTVVSGAIPGDAGGAAEPGGITGQVLSWPSGLRIPETGERPAWFWPATGRVAPIGGLPRQPSGYQFVRTTGGWAVQAGLADQAG